MEQQKNSDALTRNTKKTDDKKEYKKPALSFLGTIAEITGGPGGSGADQFSGS